MRNKKLENLLRTEADRAVPDDKEAIRARLGYRRARTGYPDSSVAAEEPVRARRSFGWIAAPVAALLIAAVVLTLVFTLPGGGGGGSPLPQPFKESVVRVDINPSVKFSVAKDGIVTAQTACNKDGAILLMKREFVGRGIDDAVAEVVSLAKKYEFLTVGSGKTVNLKVLNDDEDVEEALLGKLKSRVEKQLITLELDDEVELNSAGKNEVVDYLVAYGNYSRRDAEKLSADELEDLLEDLLEDEDDGELDDFTAELASGMTDFLTEITNRCRAVITMLRGLTPDGEEYPLNAEARKMLKDYIRDFAFEAEIENFDAFEEEEYAELTEDFEEELKEAEKSLRELTEDPEDGEDVSEDWYDRYKIYVKAQKNA